MSSIEGKDPEADAGLASHLANDVVKTFSWNAIRVVVKDRKSKQPLPILDDAAGHLLAGEMLAIMGPSGSGKTTLLNTLAHRVAAAGASTSGTVSVNGLDADTSMIRHLSSYVEQEDALIGSITVRETVAFAAKLSLPSNVSRKELYRRVDDLVASFGLQSRADTIIGTPIRKGLSGGQKKRVGIASQLVTNPKILFLDEPTSGLDSALSSEVIRYLKEIGRQNNLIIICSIHQPSTATYRLFDKLALMSCGRTCYFGAVDHVDHYFARIGHPIPAATNPAEYLLDLINVDLDRDGQVRSRTDYIIDAWARSHECALLHNSIASTATSPSSMDALTKSTDGKAKPWTVLFALLHRSWIKAYRDIVAYQIRVAMYLGLAIMMGTVFLRMQSSQEYIQPFINCIFFGGAFMSFMAVAYVPAFIEDLHTFQRERANGLVGPSSFIVSNFIIGLPFLFLIAVIFSVVQYWLSNFRADGQAFMMWIMWLFLDLLAAESLVVFVSSIFPVFVVALAITAFMNGLWMSVMGFLVPLDILNPFWKYAFHYIDYQAYVFQGMMVSEFEGRTYSCDGSEGNYQCMYPGDLNVEGKIRGTDVLRAFSINTGREGQWVGIMIAIIVVYRLLAYLVLRFLRK